MSKITNPGRELAELLRDKEEALFGQSMANEAGAKKEADAAVEAANAALSVWMAAFKEQILANLSVNAHLLWVQSYASEADGRADIQETLSQDLDPVLALMLQLLLRTDAAPETRPVVEDDKDYYASLIGLKEGLTAYRAAKTKYEKSPIRGHASIKHDAAIAMNLRMSDVQAGLNAELDRLGESDAVKILQIRIEALVGMLYEEAKQI